MTDQADDEQERVLELEAALEQRTQERDELDGQADRWTHRCVQAEERVRELEAALRRLVDDIDDHGRPMLDVLLRAREALREGDDES